MTLPPIGHNGGPPLDDLPIDVILQPVTVHYSPNPDFTVEQIRARAGRWAEHDARIIAEPWYDLRLLRLNGKPLRPMQRTTSRTPMKTDVNKPLLGRRIWGWKDIKNSLNGGPLRHQKVTPWRPVPLEPYVMDTTGTLPRTRPGQLDHVPLVNETSRRPYREEHRAGRLSDEQYQALENGLAVKPTQPPQIAVHLNGIIQKARAGADMKELAPEHLDIAVKRQAEAGRVALRCAVDAARAKSSAQVYALAKAASETLMSMAKKARGGSRSGAGRPKTAANDNLAESLKKISA